jgi:uncharacterized protein
VGADRLRASLLPGGLTTTQIVYTVGLWSFCSIAAKIGSIEKHGISLSRAADFDFDAAIFVVDDRNDYGEVRIKAIGFLDARLYALVFTQEGENIRAISLRKASKDEESNYEDGN